MKYSKEDLNRLVLELADTLGMFPTKKDIDKSDAMPSYNTCLRYGLKIVELSVQYKEEVFKVEGKRCIHCSTLIPYDKMRNRFCNHTCAALHNNSLRTIVEPTPKTIRGREFAARAASKEMICQGYCESCNGSLGDHRLKISRFCSYACHRDAKKDAGMAAWVAGERPSTTNKTLRGFLTKLVGYKCSICGIAEWNGKPITLEVEHISGDSGDNSKENVCLICPNCHSQTDTFKGRNKGNGRHVRRQRYAEGKSY